LPFESNWTRDEFIVSIYHFLNQLVTSIKGNEALKFVRSFIIEQRFIPIFGKHQKDNNYPCNNPSKQHLNRKSLQFSKSVERLTTLFNQMTTYAAEEQDGQMIRDVYLANFMETILQQLLGVANINPFFQNCF